MPGLWCTQRIWYSRLLSQVLGETWLWVNGGCDITRNQNTKIHDARCGNTPFKGSQIVSSTVIVCLAVYRKSSGMEKQLSWCDFLEIWNQFRLDRTLVAQRRPGDLAIVMQSWDLAEESDENKMHHVLVKTQSNATYGSLMIFDDLWCLASCEILQVIASVAGRVVGVDQQPELVAQEMISDE